MATTAVSDLGTRRRRPRAALADTAATATILLVGLGAAGRQHWASLQRLVRQRIVLYRSGYGAPAPEIGTFPVETDLANALAHRPQAAVVANPTALHLPFALAAARSGCHLLVERPLADSLAGAQELLREVRTRGLVALAGYQLRFHPALRRIKEWIESGAIGAVVSVQVSCEEYLPGRRAGGACRTSYAARRDLGGGVLLTLSHPFDYLRWLLGEISAVRAQAQHLRACEPDLEEAAAVALHFASGAVGQVELRYSGRPPSHSLRLFGLRGAISWDLSEHTAYLLDGSGRVSATAGPSPGFTVNDLFVDEMRHFLACVAGHEQPACTLGDGLAAMRIALAARESAATGKLVNI